MLLSPAPFDKRPTSVWQGIFLGRGGGVSYTAYLPTFVEPLFSLTTMYEVVLGVIGQ